MKRQCHMVVPKLVLQSRAFPQDLVRTRLLYLGHVREAVLARALRGGGPGGCPARRRPASRNCGDVLQCINTPCSTAEVRQRVPGRVPEPTYIKRVPHEGGPVQRDVLVEAQVRSACPDGCSSTQRRLLQQARRPGSRARGRPRASSPGRRAVLESTSGQRRRRTRAEVAPSFFMHGEEANQLIGVDCGYARQRCNRSDARPTAHFHPVILMARRLENAPSILSATATWTQRRPCAVFNLPNKATPLPNNAAESLPSHSQVTGVRLSSWRPAWRPVILIGSSLERQGPCRGGQGGRRAVDRPWGGRAAGRAARRWRVLVPVLDDGGESGAGRSSTPSGSGSRTSAGSVVKCEPLVRSPQQQPLVGRCVRPERLGSRYSLRSTTEKKAVGQARREAMQHLARRRPCSF